MKKLIHFVLLCILFSSCYNEKKATKQTTRAYLQYNKTFTGLLAKWYPPKPKLDSTHVEFKYAHDTNYVTVDCDSAIRVKTKLVRVPCNCIPDTVVKTRTIIQNDPIELARLNDLLELSTDSLQQVREDRANLQGKISEKDADIKKLRRHKVIMVCILGGILLISIIRKLKPLI